MTRSMARHRPLSPPPSLARGLESDREQALRQLQDLVEPFRGGFYLKLPAWLKALIVRQVSRGLFTARELAALLRISSKSMLRWMHGGVQRKEGGRGPLDRAMENCLSKQINMKMQDNEAVTKAWVRERALQLHRDGGFRASDGWLTRFMARRGYRLAHGVLRGR
jgi:hypothetical protein